MPRHVALWLMTILIVPTVQLVGNIQPPQENKTADKSAQKAQPTSGDLSWMPKEETGALQFLKDNPEADGRGVIVAIFDTGVDPGAIGLQTTPDGKPKVIDVIDGTGSGDVSMSKPKKTEDNKLTGLTGRTLKLDPEWKNPKGEFRLGMKVGYELYPDELVPVVKKEREEDFRKDQAAHKAELQRKLADWNEKHPKPDDKQKAKKKELEAQIALIDELLKSYSDPGPIYDCVVFHDGEHYRAVVDTDEDGDLADEKVLTNYRVAQEWSTFADPANLNFAANIYEDGETLSLVADTGAHGTHVAGITAAYFPDQPEWNGVAPGAQIVSVKIGDTRLEGMESGPGLIRGLKAVLDNKCDLINMSYGEPSSTPNQGYIAELYSEIVNEHDVIFLSSAGNAGPALTTVGAPGGTTSALIGVGAYVSPEMMRSEYSLRESLPGLPYTWTSRGPTADGDLGVDIFAPGGAIAPVPLWTRQPNQQMNGTSMASPNACGNVALLLSAAKQKKLAYTPNSVRRALQNTAQKLEGVDVFSAGPGLLQVEKAWDYMQANSDSYFEKLSFDVRVPAMHNGRGIYLRERYQTQSPANYRITVSPELKKRAPIKERLDISITAELKSTADWVTSGDLLHLNHGGNRFDVEVDPTGLKPGVHYAEVQAIDRTRPESGPLFRVPVTVVIPEPLEEPDGFASEVHSFVPGQINRLFVDVPAGATWAELKLELVDTPDTKFFRVHTMQLVQGAHFEQVESGTYYPLTPDNETVHTFSVVPGRMLEIDVAQYWSILGASKVRTELRFHGAEPNEQTIPLATGEGAKPVRFYNQLPAESLSPSGKLTTWRRTLTPTKTEVIALSRDRDKLPDSSSVYELSLQYTLKMSKSGNVKLRLLPLEDLLYDSTLASFVYHVYDKNGQRITTNDMFPDAKSLKSGDYKVDVRIMHHDPALLEKAKSTPLTVDQNLSSPVSLKFWSSPAAAAANRSDLHGISLATGQGTTVYVGEPDVGSIASSLSSGDRLRGSVTYSANDDAPTQYIAEYTYAKAASSSSSSSKSGDSKDSLEDQIRDLKVAKLKTLDPESEDFTKLFTELREAKPDDREPLAIKLDKLDSDDKRKTRLEAVISAADELIASFDQDEIAATLGRRVPQDDDDAEKAHKKAEKERDELVDALYRKARAIGYRELPDVVAKKPIEDQAKQDDAFKSAVKALSVWADLNDDKYYLIRVRQLRREEHFAQAIQELNKHIDHESPLLHYKKRRDMLSELGWDNWENWQQMEMLIKFPEKHPPYK